jgi:hypothetical protein
VVFNPFLVDTDVTLYVMETITPEARIKLIVPDIHAVYFPVCITQNPGYETVSDKSVYA